MKIYMNALQSILKNTIESIQIILFYLEIFKITCFMDENFQAFSLLQTFY